MAGRAAPPLALRFNLAHGVAERRGFVLLHVFELGRNRSLEPPSAAYYQFYRDESLVEEQRGSLLYVSAPGRYKALAFWDDGRTGVTPEVVVTAGMIRDAGTGGVNPYPIVTTFNPDTHKVNRRTGEIEPRIVRRWHVVTALVALVVAALLWWWQTGPFEQPAPRPADQAVVVPTPTTVPAPTKAPVLHDPPTYVEDLPPLLSREEAERRIAANPKRYRLLSDDGIMAYARAHGLNPAEYHRGGVVYHGLADAQEMQLYAYSVGDSFVLLPRAPQR